MRRWTFLMIGGTLLLAGGFVAVQIYLMKSSTKPHDEPADNKTSPAWATQTPHYQTRPLSSKSPETTKSDSHESLLEVIGGLTRANLTQTNVTIGMLADAQELAKPIYEVEEADKLLDEISDFIDEVERQFIQLPPSVFNTEEDRKDMEQARSVTTLLRAQIKALKGYWATLDKEHAERFQKARMETLVGLDKLMHKQPER
jgi:hypothetical protein